MRSLDVLTEQCSLVNRSKRNLGTFSSCFLEPSIRSIFEKYITLNAVDDFAYPEIAEIKKNCKHFLLQLLHATPADAYEAIDTSGSSEAILIALIHLKKLHQANHSSLNIRPYLYVAENAHIAWHKAAKYLNIDIKILPLCPYTFEVKYNSLQQQLDLNCLGVIATLGNPLTMQFDNVDALNKLLNQHYLKTNHWIPIHIDGASGGYLAPYQYPETKNDFRLEHVISINVSSHKFGLLPPSLGWLITRATKPFSDLKDNSDYIGQSIQRKAIHYSHSGAYLLAQNHVIEAIGHSKLKNKIQNIYGLSDYLVDRINIELPEILPILSQQHVPGFAFRLNAGDIDELSLKLRTKGWLLPTYTLRCHGQPDVRLARIVIKIGFDEKLVSELIDDIKTLLN
jgi:glutamate decarboxylase